MLDFDLGFNAGAVDAARVPFSGALGVAPFQGPEPPNRPSFERVDGFNLSHSGISYVADGWPAYDQLMVALGDERSPVLVSARILACRVRDDKDDRTRYEVQCEFDKWHT